MSSDPEVSCSPGGDDDLTWLKYPRGEKALAWVKKQNARTMAKFGDELFKKWHGITLESLRSKDRFPPIKRYGSFVYNFQKDNKNPKGRLQRTTLDGYQKVDIPWETVFDLDKYANATGKDWVWTNSTAVSGTTTVAIEPEKNERAIFCLAVAGGEKGELFEYDLVKKAFVHGGFELPVGRNTARWFDPDTLVVESTVGEGMETAAGYPRTIRLWRRGTQLKDAMVIFEIPKKSSAVWCHVDRTTGSKRMIFVEQQSRFQYNGWIGDETEEKTKLDLPPEAKWKIYGDWMALELKHPYEAGETTYAAGTLLGISVTTFLKGEPNFSVLLEAAQRRTIEKFIWINRKLVIHYRDTLVSHLTLAIPGNPAWELQTLDGIPAGKGRMRILPLDFHYHETNGQLLVVVEDPITPERLYLLDINAPQASRTPALLKTDPHLFNANGLKFEVMEADAEDGEKIPYTAALPKKQDKPMPIMMTAYGAFARNLPDNYLDFSGNLLTPAQIGRVKACSRGGGDLGPSWHDGGRGPSKSVTMKDTAAVGQDLVDQNLTTPELLFFWGESFGGLVGGNMLTRYPDVYGGVVLINPLADMLNYTNIYPSGKAWTAELLDPDIPKDREHIRNFDFLSAIEPGRDYPPCLILTAQTENVCLPAHGRMAAYLLQKRGYSNCYFYEVKILKHGSSGSNQNDTATAYALGYRFVQYLVDQEKK
jgi:prolyl oligopeptidase